MKTTGERPVEGSTPDSLLALHDAGYREVAVRLGPGRVVDIGSGLGDATSAMAADDRTVIGIDYDAATARSADRKHGKPGRLRFAAMDGARIGIAPDSCEQVCSSHVIEHFVNPERHVAEVARILAPGGTAFFLTPNAPADFENPFHVYLFEPEQLRSMLALFFDEVEVLGLEGDEVFQEDFAKRRASGEKLLKLDVFNLRKRLPHKAYVFAYERLLPVVYKLIGSKSGVGSGITDDHLFMTETITPTTPVLFAIARKPRAS